MCQGMQRFGTACIPTHTIGLALLKGDWHRAVSLILRKRPGEHPDVVAARDAWLVDEDLEKALELMPRRVVAERCILESYKNQNGDTRNAMGALSTVRISHNALETTHRPDMPDPAQPQADVCACLSILRLERHCVRTDSYARSR